MTKRLENKVAIITGGGQGIGAAAAIVPMVLIVQLPVWSSRQGENRANAASRALGETPRQMRNSYFYSTSNDALRQYRDLEIMQLRKLA